MKLLIKLVRTCIRFYFTGCSIMKILKLIKGYKEIDLYLFKNTCFVVCLCIHTFFSQYNCINIFYLKNVSCVFNIAFK